MSSIHISPSISNHEAGWQMQVISLFRMLNHSWGRLAAVALVFIDVITDENIVQWQLR
jgi:hypothetical protein